jgi:hypothetical protein
MQGIELLRSHQTRRHSAARTRQETYARFLNELSETPYSYNKAFAGAPDRLLDTADELGRRLRKLRVAVTLVGSGAVARVADEFPAHFQQFTIRRLELDGDDSERRRDAREGVRANTFAAYEILEPYVVRLSNAMRKDWNSVLPVGASKLRLQKRVAPPRAHRRGASHDL